ncbi:type VI secretion system protein ImpG [Candidatus Pantoea symbiotica]|jgi:type VI secretion system protein ImpG|uniref:Type VI secretion system protein ImpG n=1 Tax=Candidatus Pantoea symbiotica TaxID=1884370 RepID=A0A1I4AWV1_9GAMM|nr:MULTISPECIES: type VI secretion system baseplate subunit TssF [Pantoea]KAJ9433914.1 type VI secretion system baseplate subunit TssF [Pantoea sp. YR343]MRT22415.1 type VI secretion system baseplate subunit TssF [Enterobacteriaceae bacterium RIT697]SFK60670.1 type VI secretion system protein ImpG [Pantoea symbiotica]SFU96700.1 type VI secretion system protein ImpG [Pantoea sp. YR525]
MNAHDFLKYFDSEMRYLKAAAQEFAEEYPEAGRRLGVDGKSLKMDDSVEQLFQGFSLMMAQMRRKIDDGIPELTEPLLGHLLPVVNRTLPSMSVVELTPDRVAQVRDAVLPAGTTLLTRPMDITGLRCPYRTTDALKLHPLTLGEITTPFHPDGHQMISLRFSLSPQADPSQIDLSDIPLYIHGDRPVQSLMYQALTNHIERITVRQPQSDNCDPKPFSGDIRARWQQHWHSVWPESDSPALCGEVRPLLEYFSFPARYAFFTLSGLNTLLFNESCREVILDIHLSQPLPRDISLPADALRIHCVPVINLFTLNAEPLKVKPAVLDYRLRPHRLRDQHTEIYSVDEVAASETLDKRRYVPYRHFRQKGGMLQRKESWPERYFHTRVWRGVSGLYETLLMLGGDESETDRGEDDATLFMNITCTNGNYPRMALEKAVFDGSAVTGNLTLQCTTRHPPSMPYYPPTTQLFQWHVMSLLHPRALSQMINDAASLRAVLALFDWSNDDNNRRRISGIRHVSWRQDYNASYHWHGVRIRVALDETQFSGTGDARLFCELLEQFLTQYASVVRFTQLTVLLTASGTEWAWPERRIDRVLM